jgi:uncharacterized integral membrane protein
VRVSTVLILVPVVILAAIIAVANRETVVFRLDPFSADSSTLAFAMPLYLLVFLAILLGVLLGGLTVALRRLRARRAARPLPVGDHALTLEPPAKAKDSRAE